MKTISFILAVSLAVSSANIPQESHKPITRPRHITQGTCDVVRHGETVPGKPITAINDITFLINED